MPEFICNTSPLQYLHQLGRLDLLRVLTGGLPVPTAVAEALEDGKAAGFDVPAIRRLKWINVVQPISAPALPLAADLGRGEAAVLAFALESTSPLVILDDAVARRAAVLLSIPFIGTLGLLLEAKRKGLIAAVAPELATLAHLCFRIAPATRDLVLRLAGEPIA